MDLSRIQVGRIFPVRPQSEKQRRQTEGSTATEPARGDQVHLSAAALALSEAHAARTMTPERVQLYRERVAQGFYEQPEVIEELARRLLRGRVM